MNLRPLLPSDLPTVDVWLQSLVAEHRAWWTDAYGAEPTTSLLDAVAAERDELTKAAEKDECFVRVYGGTSDTDGMGTPIGIVYAMVRPDRYMGFPIGVLAWIYVDPAGRGRGVAGELMDAAEAWFVARGAAGREVFVTAANERAVGLYARHGYRIVDHRMLKRG